MLINEIAERIQPMRQAIRLSDGRLIWFSRLWCWVDADNKVLGIDCKNITDSQAEKNYKILDIPHPRCTEPIR